MWLRRFCIIVATVAGWMHGNPLVRAAAPEAVDPFGGKHALVVGIDGCRSDALQAAKVPNLKSLIDKGTVCYNVYVGGELNTKTEQHTSSGPGWASILTGVWADKHKVVDNEFKNSQQISYLK